MDLVVDCGSSCVKVGFAGDDAPSYLLPSALSSLPRKELTDTIEFNSKDKGNIFPIQRGTVVDFEEPMTELWSKIEQQIGIKTRLNERMSHEINSVLIAESPRGLHARHEWAKKLFEEFQIPSLSIMNSAPLMLFASGRTTGLAVDIGAGLTSVVPVYEGLPLVHSSLFLEHGGQDVTQSLQAELLRRGVEVDFAYARILKEKMAFVVPSRVNIPPLKSTASSFFLPDGEEVTVESSVFTQCCEGLLPSAAHRGEGSLNGEARDLVSLVCESLRGCDADTRPNMALNIVISGGTSMITGLGDRLNEEVMSRLNQSEPLSFMDAKVIPSSIHIESGYNKQRKTAVWIGASMMASFDAYKSLCVTKEEYDEGGEQSLFKACF